MSGVMISMLASSAVVLGSRSDKQKTITLVFVVSLLSTQH